MAHWIKFTVSNKLDKTEQVKLYKCVTHSVGASLIHVSHIQTRKGSKETSFYHVLSDRNQHVYVIPLVRDLTLREGHDLAHKLHAQFAQLNFILDYSQTASALMVKTHIEDPYNLQEILDVWGKAQHTTWQQNLLDKGWRYGVHMSQKQKTHPWLQPWESLPQAARDHNIQAVEKLIDVLKHAGYQIVKIPQA